MKKIKNNRFVRGLYFYVKNYFGRKRNNFGYIADSVKVTPPHIFGNKKNIFIYDYVGIGPNCFISATNAKLELLTLLGQKIKHKKLTFVKV
jgi:acetyltransferase-like isoleucine patch superfamily enzyme